MGKEKVEKYIYHSLPAGAMSVATKGKSKNRKVDAWKFYYDGWKAGFSTALARHGANTTDLFPEENHGSLDGEKIERMVLTADIVKNAVGIPDALFFHQFLLSMYDTNKSGVEDGGGINFYDNV